MAGEVAHNVVAEAVGIRLNNAADDINLTAWLCRLNAAHHCLVGTLNQQLVLLRDIPGQEGRISIAVHHS